MQMFKKNKNRQHTFVVPFTGRNMYVHTHQQAHIIPVRMEYDQRTGTDSYRLRCCEFLRPVKMMYVGQNEGWVRGGAGWKGGGVGLEINPG